MHATLVSSAAKEMQKVDGMNVSYVAVREDFELVGGVARWTLQTPGRLLLWLMLL